MQAKRIWLITPALLMPYIIVALLAAMITIISMPLAIALAEIDFLMLVMSGSSIIAASITMFRRQEISLWVVCGMVLSQFIFCVDVVMAIVVYVRLKRKRELLMNKNAFGVVI